MIARRSDAVSPRALSTLLPLAVTALVLTVGVSVPVSFATAASTRIGLIGPIVSERSGSHTLTDRLNVELAGLSSTLGATRAQVEQLFRFIDRNTTFKVASKIKGVPRTLGQDKSIYTAVEINGDQEVIDVQVITILDQGSKTILESQVAFDSLVCREFSTKDAQAWCTGRILNTNASGLITATKTRTFGGLRITVRTYRSSASSSAPVVSIDVSAV